MPGENLTRIEASTRADLLSVESYRIELDLTSSETTFRSVTTVRFDAKAGTSTFIDAITEKVHSITLNGESHPVSLADGVRIALPNLAASNELEVDADMFYMNTGEGLHRFVDPVDGEVYLYSQFEVPDSRRVFAVFEQPDLKATFQFVATTPAHWTVISNQTTPKPVTLADGKALWEFTPTPRISSYITALIAGPYVGETSSLVSSNGKTIPLGFWCRSSLKQYLDHDYLFDITRAGFEFFEKTFSTPYPFEKYDQIMAPDFNAGAMENAGAVTFNEIYVFRGASSEAIQERRVVTILHELAHMWFGDLVTMRWWNDLWLNESFAEYTSTLATAEATSWDEAWTTFASGEKAWAYRADQLPSTHPIVAEINDLEDVMINFDGITYAKGASVLKQLAAWVGREPFAAGVAEYFKKHAFGNTVLADLLAELEKASGRDLSAWSKQWLETAGVNKLELDLAVDDSGVITKFDVLQSAISEHPTIRDHRMAIGFYNLVDGKLVRTDRLELDVTGVSTSVTDFVGKARPDLILLNDDDLAYAKIRLDSESWKFALANLGKFEDSLARTMVWMAAWDATRDGETPSSEFVSLVLNNIQAETQGSALMTLLRQLVTVSSLYVAPETSSATITKVGKRLWELAKAAKPSSDAQLMFTRFTAKFANTAELGDVLDGLLSGSIKLNGLTIDQDLRWELLIGLSGLGRVDQATIDAELAKDNTANGQKFAFHAETVVPTAAAKAAIWEKLVSDLELSNTLVGEGSMAFTNVWDTTLLENYVDKYFDMVLPAWEARTFKIAEYLIEGLYPTPLASDELVAKTRAFIARPEIAAIPALKRIVVENLANVERALKAQRSDK
jgi:aminopeptidase N